MSKVSKLFAMAIVVLAVITLSVSVNASTSTLRDYVGGIHNINGMVFEIENDNQKTAVLNYIDGLDDATADSILNDIRAAEKLVSDTGATSVEALSANVKEQVLNLANSAASKAGLKLEIPSKNTFQLVKANGEVLVSSTLNDEYNAPAAQSNGTTTGTTSTTATTNGSTLLYTGSNYAVYGVVALAIVAVAIVVKKRA